MRRQLSPGKLTPGEPAWVQRARYIIANAATIRRWRLWPAVLLAISAGLFAQRAAADTLVGTSIYNYQGSNAVYTVPVTADYIVIKLWGSGGAAGFGSNGGGGAYILARQSVVAGQNFTVSVGQGGYVGGNGGFYGGDTWDYPTFNGGGPAWFTGSGGQGGGYTLVQGPDGSVMVAAGGGGGSDWNAQNGFMRSQPNGGASGHSGSGDQPGAAGGSGSRVGGAGSISVGGGGGGGWIGGTGGGVGNTAGGGGGGVSGWSGGFSILTYEDGNLQNAGNASDPDRGSAGSGGSSYGPGSSGAVIIRAYKTAPPTITSATTVNAYLGQTLSYQITASNTPVSYSFSWLGANPGNSSIIAQSGLITISAATVGSYNFNVSASSGTTTASATVTLNIAAPVISGSPSVTPLVVAPGLPVTLLPNGYSDTGIAWIENTVFPQVGSPISLGNQYGSAIDTPIIYIPGAGSGLYTYGIRVVDPLYNYHDFYTQFTVTPSSTSLTWPTPAAIVFGTPLSGTQLDATASVTGTFTYSPPAGTIPNAGSQTLTVSFNPTDTRNYNPSSGAVSLTVLPASQSVQISPTSGNVLAGSTVTFTATGGVNGYAWGGTSGASGGGGSQTLTFPTPGTFSVTVYSVAGGNFGPSNTATATVSVAASYSVAVTAGAGGTVSGGGTFGYNAMATIQATPATGFVFSGWTGSDLSPLPNAYASTNSLIVRGSYAFAARFTDVTNPPIAGTVDFGAAAIATSSGTRTSLRTALTTNLGNSALELRSFAIATNSADFAAEQAGGLIPANGSISPHVAFTPSGSQTGTRTGRLIVVTGDATNPIVAYNLTGIATNGGLPPTLNLDLTSLALIFPGDTIALNVEAISPTGNIVYYDWQLVGPAGASGWTRYYGPSPDLRCSHPEVVSSLGSYYFQVIATDDAGLTVTSSLPFTVIQGLYSRILSARAEPPAELRLWFGNSPTANRSIDVWKNR